MADTNLTNALAQRKKDKPKLYREVADEAKAAMIAADVAFKRQILDAASQRPAVDLDDLEDVKSRTDTFLASCEAASVVPTFLGLAVSFGYTREGLYKHLRNHSQTPTAKYIGLVKEMLADAMITASLTRTTDAATTIFALKNLHGFADKLEIEPVTTQQSALGPLADPEELRKRILETVVIDDDD